MIALIDADSLVYIIAYNFKDETQFAEEPIRACCDDFIHAILKCTQSDKYLGVFSSDKNFRYEVYKYQPYKGNRPPKPDFLTLWGPTVKKHLTEKWGFYTSPHIEADDIVVAVASQLQEPWVICSPDKDLRQIAGFHYDYRTGEPTKTVTEEDAARNLWAQLLTGDSTDNIAGIPGLGEVKVKKLFDEAANYESLNAIVLSQIVKTQFNKYFGPYYGDIIYWETLLAVMMIQPAHPFWYKYEKEIQNTKTNYVRDTPKIETPEDVTVLDQLGWAVD